MTDELDPLSVAAWQAAWDELLSEREHGRPPDAVHERDQAVANATVEALRRAGWLRKPSRPVGFNPDRLEEKP